MNYDVYDLFEGDDGGIFFADGDGLLYAFTEHGLFAADTHHNTEIDGCDDNAGSSSADKR